MGLKTWKDESIMKKFIFIIVLIVAMLGYLELSSKKEIARRVDSDQVTKPQVATADSLNILNEAVKNRQSNIQVEGEGIVIKILPDDTKGSRHQRFILELSSGQTLLIAHNIDLAPRIDSLKLGDKVRFYGEYEWNNKGGVLHWTHHDPKNRHPNGWLKHDRKTYQ